MLTMTIKKLWKKRKKIIGINLMTDNNATRQEGNVNINVLDYVKKVVSITHNISIYAIELLNK